MKKGCNRGAKLGKEVDKKGWSRGDIEFNRKSGKGKWRSRERG